MFGRILTGLAAAAGAFLAVAVAKQKRQPVYDCGRSQPVASLNAASGERRDYLQITRLRGRDIRPQWLLQGFGRYQCFLLFASWQETMEQATFRMETLAAETAELVQLSGEYLEA